MEEEKLIKTSPEPVTFEGTQKILSQMNKCICKIYNKGEGTGFFTEIPFDLIFLPVLITNNHVLGENDIKNNNVITLSLNCDINIKKIKINGNRKIYTNKELDITIIEIKENEDNINNEYIDLDDNILNYFMCEENENVNYLNNIYSNKSLYILHYPKGNNISVSYAQPAQFNNKIIYHKCSTEPGSSGAPILLINNLKLIGVHRWSIKIYENNFGILIIYAIIDFQKKNNKLIGELKNINDIDKTNSNYIIAEYEIKKDDETIRIINPYGPNFGLGERIDSHMEKEIKENCEIRINNEIIPFSHEHKFNKKGKYMIKYRFKNNITNTYFLFMECKCLVNIDLSNFNSQNITNMKGMFSECSSLAKINLSNFNTQKVTDMSNMFVGCLSLKNIDLSDFKIPNVIDMKYMFLGCLSLTKINLSNFNTQNTTEVKGMFQYCKNLKKENVITKDKAIINELISSKYFNKDNNLFF